MDAKKDKAGKAKPGTGKIGMGSAKPLKGSKAGPDKSTKMGSKTSKNTKSGPGAKPGTGKIGMGPAGKSKP